MNPRALLVLLLCLSLTANAWNVEWTTVAENPLQRVYEITIQNQLAVTSGFPLGIFFQNTTFALDKTGQNVLLLEWKPLSVTVPTFNNTLINATCNQTTDNVTWTMVDCSWNKIMQNGTVDLNILQWKPTKMNFVAANISGVEKNRAQSGVINVGKFGSKCDYDDLNQSYGCNGTKKFRLSFEIPVQPLRVGFGSSGLVGFYDYVTMDEYHPWWSSSWLYRRSINITNPSSSALENFSAWFVLNTSGLIGRGKMNETCKDIRVLNAAENGELDYAVINCNTSYTKVFVRIPSFAAGNNTIYLYYGNPTVESTENWTGVMLTTENYSAFYINGTGTDARTERTLVTSLSSVPGRVLGSNATNISASYGITQLNSSTILFNPNGNLTFSGWLHPWDNKSYDGSNDAIFICRNRMSANALFDFFYLDNTTSQNVFLYTQTRTDAGAITTYAFPIYMRVGSWTFVAFRWNANGTLEAWNSTTWASSSSLQSGAKTTNLYSMYSAVSLGYANSSESKLAMEEIVISSSMRSNDWFTAQKDLLYYVNDETTNTVNVSLGSDSDRNATTYQRNYVNANISVFAANLDAFIWNWNGTNFTIYDSSIALKYSFDNLSSLGETAAKVVDTGFNAINGTVNGGNTTVLSGKVGQAMAFDGVDDYISVPFESNTPIGIENGSIEFWVKLNRTFAPTMLDSDGVLTKNVAGNHIGDSILVFQKDSGKLQYGRDGTQVANGGFVNSQRVIWDANTWYHVVVTWQQNSKSMYINGVLNATGTGVGAYLNSTGNLVVGEMFGSAADFLAGYLDELTIYNRTLSAAEVAQHWNISFRKYAAKNWTFLATETGLPNGNVTFYGWANDTLSNSEGLGVQNVNISVETSVNPMMSNISLEGLTIQGATVNFLAYLFLNSTGSQNISSWIFSSNLTGTWVNETVISMSPCYQETANVSTSCGGLATGNYTIYDFPYDWRKTTEFGGSGIYALFDGNWNTFTYPQPSTPTDPLECQTGRMDINYSKPFGATGAVWNWLGGDGTKIINATMNESCWKSSTSRLALMAVNTWTGNSYGICSNGTPYSKMTFVGHVASCLYPTPMSDGWGITLISNGNRLYEESITWLFKSGATDANYVPNETSINITKTLPLTAGNYSYMYYFNTTNGVWNSTKVYTFKSSENYPKAQIINNLVESPLAGTDVSFGAYFNDTLGVSGYILSTDFSGSFTNDSWVAFSLGDYGNWTNFTRRIGVYYANYRWIVYVNNTVGQWNNTGFKNIQTRIPPFSGGSGSSGGGGGSPIYQTDPIVVTPLLFNLVNQQTEDKLERKITVRNDDSKEHNVSFTSTDKGIVFLPERFLLKNNETREMYYYFTTPETKGNYEKTFDVLVDDFTYKQVVVKYDVSQTNVFQDLFGESIGTSILELHKLLQQDTSGIPNSIIVPAVFVGLGLILAEVNLPSWSGLMYFAGVVIFIVYFIAFRFLIQLVK